MQRAEVASFRCGDHVEKKQNKTDRISVYQKTHNEQMLKWNNVNRELKKWKCNRKVLNIMQPAVTKEQA